MKRSDQMKKFVIPVAAGGLLAIASFAQAGEPVQLSDVQLDQVSAGAQAIGEALGAAVGNWATFTQSDTDAFADSIGQQAASYAENLSLATSVLGYGAATESISASAAALPTIPTP
jgi:hypothetical protein